VKITYENGDLLVDANGLAWIVCEPSGGPDGLIHAQYVCITADAEGVPPSLERWLDSNGLQFDELQTKTIPLGILRGPFQLIVEFGKKTSDRKER